MPQFVRRHAIAPLCVEDAFGISPFRLSKAGMPSRSEGWGGLFKDESTD
jgi:hypothetical protein